MKSFIVLFFCILGGPFTTIILANPVGQIWVEKGLVRLRHKQTDQMLKAGKQPTPVFNGDSLQTGSKTRVRLIFFQHNDEIRLYSRTYFQIQNVNKDQSWFSMLVGKGSFMIKKLLQRRKQRQRFSLSTTTAVIGVKGTRFIVEAAEKATYLLTTEGVVTMKNLQFPDTIVDIPIHQASSVKSEAPPTSPIKVPMDVQEKILKRDTGNSFTDVPFSSISPLPRKGETKEKNNQHTTDAEGRKASEEQLDLLDQDLSEVEETLSNMDQESPHQTIRLTIISQ